MGAMLFALPFFGRGERMEEKIIGTFIAHEKGFGFVKPENEELEKDIFIAAKNVNGALNEDVVEVEIVKDSEKNKSKEGKIAKIVRRGKDTLVGTFQKSKSFGFVVPDDKRFGSDIFISKKNFGKARDKHKVVVRITKYPEKGRKAEGEVIEVIGNINQAGVDMMSIIKEYKLPARFPEDVVAEAKKFGDTIDLKDMKNRRDLRDRTIFTIDGEHSKDLDDAVSLEINDKGNYVLGVHIADVAYYVKEGTAIQKEAALRGTSYYFSTLVIPMLPPTLSNGICSLNPNQDRFTRTTEIEINPMGEILNFKQYKSIIHSKKKMTYESINQIFEEGISLEEYQTFIPTLRNMFQLSSILEKKKEQRGYINFGTEDFFITTDENGKPKEILPRKRGMAEKLIENFMLLANEITAIYQQNMQFLNQELPFIYRVHGYPDEKRIAEIITYLKNSGFYIEEKDYHDPKEFQLLLKSLATLPAFPAISDVLIRGLSKAKYSVNNIGHYGLALGYYTHSTSPIRRYSDLQTQYNMDKYTEQDLSRIDMEEQADKIIQICKHTTKVEKIADVTDRDITGYQFVQYMENKIGQTFTGMITYISKHHIIVRTTNYVIGTIETNELLDRGYKLIDQGTTLFDPKTKKHLRIGDLIEVVLKQTSLEDRKILFSIPNSKEKVYKKNSLLP